MATTIIMPQLGETVAEGKILTWFKAIGDDIKVGDRLFEVETDKVTVDVEAIAAGRLTAIHTGNGATAKVGATVAVIGGDTTSPEQASSHATPPKIMPAFEEVNTPTANYGRARGPGGLRITPLARRLLSQGSGNLSALAEFASSRNLSRIEERDVRAFLKLPPADQATVAPLVSSAAGVVTLNNIRTRTAERLSESWRTIPHVFQAIDIDFSDIEVVRARHKERFKIESGISLTYLPFIARACCIALHAFPLINGRLDGNSLTLSRDINLGIAVDLDHNGLVVPVVHAAQDFTLTGLARAIGRLVEKARTSRLSAADLSGGTYSITNNGAFGTHFTVPIINAPQVAILSVDAIRKKPAVISTTLGDAIVPRLIGTVGQSFDHRAFDGAYAAAFLSKLKDAVEKTKWAGELGEPP